MAYLDLAGGAGLGADRVDHLVEIGRQVERAVLPRADLDVVAPAVGQTLVVHDVVPAGRVAVLVELHRLVLVRKAHVQQMVLSDADADAQSHSSPSDRATHRKSQPSFSMRSVWRP